MRAKLTELNNEVQNEISTSMLALHPEEVTLFTQMFDYLAAVTGGGRSSGRTVPNEKHIEALIHVLDRWPSIHRFPLIDLARLIVAFAPQPLHANAGLGDRFVGALLRASDWEEHWTPPMTKAKERNILLLLRTIANSMQEKAKFENIGWALKIFAEPPPNELLTSPQRIVGSTLLLNFSCLALSSSPEPGLRSKVFVLTLQAITNQPNDAEAVYRSLVALGNTLYAAKEYKTPLSAEELTQAKSTLEGVEKTTFTPKSGQSAADLAAEKRKIVSLANEILAAL
jgi:phospholipase A-2-activating protein